MGLLNFCRERLVLVATFVVVTRLGSHPPTYPKFILYRYRNNHSTNKSCLPSLIPQKSRSSAFVQSEERSQPLPLLPPRSVHWVCLPKKIGDDIAKGTQEWKGLKVTVRLTIQNRQAKVDVVPSAAALIIKALKEPPRDRKKVKNIKHNGNITMDDILNSAKIMRPRSMSREFSGCMKEILGTAQSVGCTVDGQDPHDHRWYQ